jgi:hypothetical protein
MEARRVPVGKVAAWLARGYDFDLDIFPAVTEVAETVRGPIVSANCFDQAIARHHAARTVPQPEKASGNVLPIRSHARQQRHQAPATGANATAQLIAERFGIGD